MALTIQMSVNSGVMNKRNLSEADGMDVDEEISNKKNQNASSKWANHFIRNIFRRLKENGFVSEKICANAAIFFWRWRSNRI